MEKKNEKAAKPVRSVKGSYTVEMALISGIWLMVIFASGLLVFGSYQKVWDTAASLELAIYGSNLAVTRTTDGVKAAQTRAEAGYSIAGSKREITVVRHRNIKIPFQGLSWQQEGTVRSKVIRPVLFIEKVEAARRLLETAQE